MTGNTHLLFHRTYMPPQSLLVTTPPPSVGVTVKPKPEMHVYDIQGPPHSVFTYIQDIMSGKVTRPVVHPPTAAALRAQTGSTKEPGPVGPIFVVVPGTVPLARLKPSDLDGQLKLVEQYWPHVSIEALPRGKTLRTVLGQLSLDVYRFEPSSPRPYGRAR